MKAALWGPTAAACLFLASPGLLGASPLTPEQALQRAATSQDAPRRVRSQAAAYRLAASAPGYYVFSSPAGFAVMPADDVAAPVLGYADTPFPATDVPPNMQAWLDGYGRQIAHAVEAGAASYRTPSRTDGRESIAPMTTTTWGQGWPYCMYTPNVWIDGQKCNTVTGCVATAMAQVMKHFNYPDWGHGTAQYVWTDDNQEEQELTLDLGDMWFDWKNMIDDYRDDNYTGAQAYAVSRLMKACGYSVHMDYGVHASGANSQEVAAALYANFGYQSRYIYRDFYQGREWEDMVYHNLATVGPLYYDGANSDAGHAFVVDGYASDGYFHLNWGWNGTSDGYFLLNVLDPDQQGIGGSSYGYNTFQGAIVDAQPNTGDDPWAWQFRLGVETMDWATIDQNGLTVAGVFANLGPTTAGAEAGWNVYDPSGNLVTSLEYGQWDWGWGGSLAYMMASAEDLDRLRPGNYTFVAASRTPDNARWLDAQAHVGGCNYVNVQLGSDASADRATLPRTGSPRVTDFTLDTPMYLGCDFKASATLANREDFEVSGVASLLLLSGDSIVATGRWCPYDLENGQSTALPYTGQLSSPIDSAITPGQYTLAWAQMKNGYFTLPSYALISQRIPVNVHADPGYVELTCRGFQVDNAEAVNPDNFTVSFTLECGQGYFAQQLYVPVYLWTEDQGYVYTGFIPTTPMVMIADDQGYVSYDNVQLGALSVADLDPEARYGALLCRRAKEGPYAEALSEMQEFRIARTGIEAPGIRAVETSRWALDGSRLQAPTQGLNIIRYSDGTVRKAIVPKR